MTFAACCLPLYGLTFSPNSLLRLLMPPVFVVALLVAVVGYGEGFSAMAFGVVISIHVASIGAYFQAVSPASGTLHRFVRQLGIALACVVLGLLLIPRAMSVLVIRIQTSRGLLLINPFDGRAPYHHGEPMAFLLQSYARGFDLPRAGHAADEEREPDFWQVNIYLEGHAMVRTGLYLGHVIAVPGERVTFTDGFFRVNDGPPRPALPLMPIQGELRVPVSRVLVWPGEATNRIIGGRDRRDYAFPPEVLLLRKSALVGRPYKHWFWLTLP
ncbi:MAG: hypothetical protein RIQ79_1915 [Verrucomicrobiota bacterium]|jgi:hypothetical protein